MISDILCTPRGNRDIMIPLLIWPMLSYFIMMIFVATYGEIWINKNGLDEYQLILGITLAVGILMKTKKLNAKMLKAWATKKMNKGNKLRQKLIQKFAQK